MSANPNTQQIEIKIVNPRLKQLPQYATYGSAAVDLCACMKESLIVRPGQTVTVSTGVAVSMPSGIAALLLPRSGLGKRGLVLGNLVGLIDSDYQGEIKVLLWNRNQVTGRTIMMPEPVIVEPMDRIAQLMFMPVVRASWVCVEAFSEDTARGSGGFGSTGDGVTHWDESVAFGGIGGLAGLLVS